MEKKEMSASAKKATKIYTIELFVIATVMVVLGILILLQVIKLSGTAWKFIPYLGIAGGVLLVADLVWLALSKKRQAKSSLFDKCLTAPLGAAVFGIDIYILVKGYDEQGIPAVGADFFQYFIGSLFLYLCAAYIAMAIYHIYKPLPILLIEDEEEDKKKEETLDDVNAIIEAEQPKEEEKQEEQTEENNEEEKSE